MSQYYLRTGDNLTPVNLTLRQRVSILRARIIAQFRRNLRAVTMSRPSFTAPAWLAVDVTGKRRRVWVHAARVEVGSTKCRITL